MRRAFALLLALLALCAHALAENAGARHSVEYYYRNYCESCTPEADFAAQFRELTGLDLSQCDFTAWNAARADGQAALAEAAERLGIDDPALPMAVVDGIPYQGASQMRGALVETALSWHETLDSEILFLYVPACERCDEAEAALDALPESVTLRRGDKQIESRVRVRRVDVSADPGFAQALFEAYGVPDDRRVTPIAFFADRYLAGAEAISGRLAQEVALGWASGGVPEVAAAPEAPSPVSLAQAALTGLTAGLNTCALSMLLLFMSLVLESGRRAAPPVIAYLLAKLACYLLIGFALLRVFQRFNPTWLHPLARWLLTGIGAALIALNLSDALHAKRGDLGGVRNQLPGGVRGGLIGLIRRLTRSRALVPASAALGFIVAGGEFMCAGQLYLMQLMNAAQSGAPGQGLTLAVYCLAFLAPSAAVFGLVLAGHSHLRAAGFFARHMALIKLLTAGAMLLLIITAWLL